MKRIAILSDTHSYLDNNTISILNSCDEIWHAGDFGYGENINDLITKKNLRGVYGNIDNSIIRNSFPEIYTFQSEGLKIIMAHICGSFQKYNIKIKKLIKSFRPDILVCGHSHILRVEYDKINKLLFINPGAAGKEGFHLKRTLLILHLNNNKIDKIELINLGNRAELSQSIT